MAKTAVDESSEYQVVNRGSSFCKEVRAISRNAVRQSAASTAKASPMIDSAR